MDRQDKKTSFLVFSDDFGEHPSSCQHLFEYISAEYPVLWVNTIGLRDPTLSLRDIHKAGSKLFRMLASSLRQNRRPDQLRHDIITAPNACDFIGVFDESRSVYYCVDDFSEWPGMNQDFVAPMERELIDRCGVLVSTSTALIERMEARGRSAHLLTHGVDADLYASYRGDEHALLQHIPRPRIGYFGLFDERSDQQLLAEIAASMPEVSFVITGPVETGTSRLTALDNFYFTGAVPYGELPSMAHGFDICMLPYRVNKLTNAIQPLKLKEYIATGKPVISTPIREARALSAFIDLAESAEQWIALIARHLAGKGSRSSADTERFLDQESWSAKATEFLHHCLRASDKSA
jgi:glycosyltransferase involved in cell wall biosynthesis